MISEDTSSDGAPYTTGFRRRPDRATWSIRIRSFRSGQPLPRDLFDCRWTSFGVVETVPR